MMQLGACMNHHRDSAPAWDLYLSLAHNKVYAAVCRLLIPDQYVSVIRGVKVLPSTHARHWNINETPLFSMSVFIKCQNYHSGPCDSLDVCHAFPRQQCLREMELEEQIKGNENRTQPSLEMTVAWENRQTAFKSPWPQQQPEAQKPSQVKFMALLCLSVLVKLITGCNGKANSC